MELVPATFEVSSRTVYDLSGGGSCFLLADLLDLKPAIPLNPNSQNR
jgi:hypothetical protein